MKNFILIFCCSFFLFGCIQTTALAPSFIGSGGNIYKTGLSYGGNYLIKKDTGKSPSEHVVSIVNRTKESKYSNKKLSELIKKHIKKTKEKLKSNNLF